MSVFYLLHIVMYFIHTTILFLAVDIPDCQVKYENKV